MTSEEKPWYDPYFTIDEKYDLDEQKTIEKMKEAIKKNNLKDTTYYSFHCIVKFPNNTEALKAFVKSVMDSLVAAVFYLDKNLDSGQLLAEYKVRGLTGPQQGKFKICVQLIEKYLEGTPEDDEMINYKGVCFFFQKRFSEASQVFQSAIKVSPDKTIPHFNNAMSLKASKDYQQVIDCYQNLKRLFPSNLDARLNLSRLYTKLFYFDQAMAELEAALPLSPQSQAVINAHIGRVHFLQKDFDQARHYLDRALLMDREDPIVNLYDGDYLTYHEKWSEASLKYQTFKAAPYYYQYVLMKNKYVNMELNAPIIETTKFDSKVEKLANYEIDSELWRIVYHVRTRHLNPCLEYLKKLKVAFPQHPDVRFFIARIHIYFNNQKDALEDLTEGLASLRAAIASKSHFSKPLAQYKTEILQKKCELFGLMADISRKEINVKYNASVQALNKLADDVFNLYKGKLMLKYQYLPGDEVFERSLLKIKDNISSFSLKLKETDAELYVPNSIHSNKDYLKYYIVMVRSLLAVEELYESPSNPKTSEAVGLLEVLKNPLPLTKVYPPLAGLTLAELNLNIKNLENIERDSDQVKFALQDIARAATTMNTGRIQSAFNDQEIQLFINEGLMARYHQYFTSTSETKTIDSIERLAKIDALKVFLIICYNSKPNVQQKNAAALRGEFAKATAIPFEIAKKKTGCLCFK